jgi:hypothetical protein
MEIETLVVLPLGLPFDADEGDQALTEQVYTDVSGEDGAFSYRSDWGVDAEFHVSAVTEPESIPEFFAAWPEYTGAMEYRFLRLDARVPVDLDAFSRVLHENNPGVQFNTLQTEYFARDITASELSLVAGLLVLAMNIASPGSANSGARYQLADGRFIREESGLSSRLAEARREANRYQWPPIADTLSVRDVWNWMCEIPGIAEGQGQGPAGRALGALSFLFSDLRSPVLELVWALVGLEAVYGRGSAGIKAQLLEKSELLLGPRSTHKRTFGRMYDFRSRFVHGDIDIPLEFWDDRSPHVGNFEAEAEASMFLAASMLASTLQQLAIRDRYSLDFAYQLLP